MTSFWGTAPQPTTNESLAGFAEAVLIMAAVIAYFLMVAIESTSELARGKQMRALDAQRQRQKLLSLRQLNSGSIYIQDRPMLSPSCFDLEEGPESNEEDEEKLSEYSSSCSDVTLWGGGPIPLPLSEDAEPQASHEAEPISPRPKPPCVPGSDSEPQGQPLFRSNKSSSEESEPQEDLWERLWNEERERRRKSRLNILRGHQTGDACGAYNHFPNVQPRSHHPLTQGYYTLPSSVASWEWKAAKASQPP
eukprot:Protomagalhaensia_wolfi_Nauph_80__2043@NODE_22_length_4814_cov_65_182199_g17_i0_p3_GENE_NODE_22_length_4814_cov_65_182199_g17_i0NODE_22_length_4814_cov_65_182199_g17_i0_p3_ORF_typecomplete_len250_score25_76DUF5527/PF17665_1/4_7DUF5527/PF17665_1/1_3e03DUF5527/PF17665_1/84_NODE_22_length_4814_cov_65_182199_g17_i022432992